MSASTPLNHEQETQLRRLISSHSTAVNWLLARHERNAATREDLLGDVFELCFRHLDELAVLHDNQVRGWLLRTTRFLLANEARRGTRRRELIERLAAEPVTIMTSVEDDYVDDEVRRGCVAAVRVAFDQLTEAQREILARDANGQTGPAIAADIGMTNVAVRSRLMRARSAFRHAFQENQVHDSGEVTE